MKDIERTTEPEELLKPALEEEFPDDSGEEEYEEFPDDSGEEDDEEFPDDSGEDDSEDSPDDSSESDKPQTINKEGVQSDASDKDMEPNKPIKNKQDGLRREGEVEEEMDNQYPESEGYKVQSEVYLRDENGNIAKDPETGSARRIDFVVVKDGEVIDSVEVTSKTADKTAQNEKEDRIRGNGGNYIRDDEGDLIKIPDDVKTRVVRRD